jgi:glucose-6-phosphate 1-dehydrogenase
MFEGFDLKSNYVRFRIGPNTAIAFGLNVAGPSDDATALTREVVGVQHPAQDEMYAYERLLTDAMDGDASLFAREDYIEEAWRIVDPALKTSTPVFQYEPKSWGPAQVEQTVSPPGGWVDPVVPAVKVVEGMKAAA